MTTTSFPYQPSNLPQSAPMTPVVEPRVRQLIGAHFQTPPWDLTYGQSLELDLGADSIDMVEIQIALENEFGIEVTDQDLDGLNTVLDIIDYIKKHCQLP